MVLKVAEVKWIKIVTDIFDDEKVLLIESLPEADSIIVIWFKLLCLAGKQNNSGVFIMNNSIPYTDKMLATIFRRKEATVSMALKTFEQFGMVEILDGVITIPNWGKHQSLEQLEDRRKYQRDYQKEYRKRQKAIAAESIDESEDESLHKRSRKCLRKHNVNSLDKIRKEREEEKEGEGDIMFDSDESKQQKPKRHKYGEYQNVLLSDSDIEKLQAEFPDWKERIERLSSYMASTGKSYKNHLATIRNWAAKDKSNQQERVQQNAATTTFSNPFLQLLQQNQGGMNDDY